MGAPVETGIENFEEVILALSPSDRAKLIGWISETLVEDTALPNDNIEPADKQTAANWPPTDVKFAEDLSGKTPWYGNFDPKRKRSKEERKQAADEAWGAWASWAPEDLADQILSDRTTDSRELPRYE